MRKRWIGVIAMALLLCLGACASPTNSPPAGTEAPTTIPTHEPTPTTEPTPVPVPPAVKLTLTSKVEDKKPVDSLTSLESDAAAIYITAEVTGLAVANSFSIELSAPDMSLRASAPVELASDGGFDVTFDAPASGWMPGEYTASILQKGDTAPLAEMRFTVTQVVGPVVSGLDYLPEENLRIRGYWTDEDPADGSWLTAKLDGRPVENYLVSMCNKESLSYIIDYYTSDESVMMVYSDKPTEAIVYMPLKVRPDMEWSYGSEQIVVKDVELSFSVRGTAYEKCVELEDTIANEDGTKTVLHLIYAPKVGLIYEWAEPNTSDSPSFYVKSTEPIAKDEVVKSFEKVPGYTAATAEATDAPKPTDADEAE